jgi:HEXXH motif-containing protein
VSAVAATAEPIDWGRMAEPQADGYDTDVILRLAEAAGLRHPSAARRSGTGSCLGPVEIGAAPARGLMSDAIVPAAGDHPNLAAAAGYLGAWPAGYKQFERLIDTIYPYTDPAQAAQGDWSLGSSSHSYEKQWGTIYVTVDDAMGLAQGLIHEAAHQKLTALGVGVGKADRIIVNDPSERYAHPHLTGGRQPMTAVFHEQYTFIHVAALNLRMLAKAKEEHERQRILMLLARNITRMEAGHDELVGNIRTDREGTLFIDAFSAWSTTVLATGRAELDANGYGFAKIP